MRTSLPSILPARLEISGELHTRSAPRSYISYPSNDTIYTHLFQVARPSQYGLPDKEEILVTKDGVRIRCYVLIQRGDDVAIQSPTLLCLHVRTIYLSMPINTTSISSI